MNCSISNNPTAICLHSSVYVMEISENLLRLVIKAKSISDIQIAVTQSNQSE